MTREEDYELILNTEKKINYEKGIEDGIEKGIEKGIESNQKEMVLNMLNKGLELSLISEITNLSIEKINQIKETL